MKKIAYVAPFFPNFINQFEFNEIDIISEKTDLIVFTIAPWKGKSWSSRSKELIEKKVLSRKIQLFYLSPYILKNIFYNDFFFDDIYPKNNLNDVIKSKYLRSLVDYYSLIVRKNGISHIHADFATTPGLIAYLVSKRNKITYSVKVHAHDIYRNDLEKKHPYIEDIFSNADIIFAVHSYGKELLLKKYPLLDPTKLIVNRAGINLTYFRNDDDSRNKKDFVIVSVGRLDEKKGHDTLIQSCHILKRSLNNFKCYIIGYGPLEKELKDLIIKFELIDNVFLLGKLPPSEVKEYLKIADVYVLMCQKNKKTGDMDGIPTSIMEAMAMKIPVITTNISGIPEAVIHNKTGVVVNPGDHEKLYEALLKLMNAKELCSRIGNNGREMILNHFNMEINATEMLSQINKIK